MYRAALRLLLYAYDGRNTYVLAALCVALYKGSRDPAALGAALLAYGSDAGLRVAHGAAGQARVAAEFSLDGMVARYAGVYEQALAAAGVPVGGR